MDGDREEILSRNRATCICASCPTYNECMRADESLAFCIEGMAANCTFDRKGCLCPPCPVFSALQLKSAYYCIRGPEIRKR